MHDATTAELAVALALAAPRRLRKFVRLAEFFRLADEQRWASGWST